MAKADQDKKTPREEFEGVFGEIDDYQWQWLKEFFHRNPMERQDWGMMFQVGLDDQIVIHNVSNIDLPPGHQRFSLEVQKRG